MRKCAVLLFSMLFVFTFVSAQQQAEPRKERVMPTIETRVEKMATDLGLTATEKASLKTLFEKQDAEMKKFRDEANKDSPEYKDKMKEIRKNQMTELKTLLGDEKYAKLQAMREEERKKN